MTTVADVRAAWATYVWADASIEAMTPNVVDYDLFAVLRTPNRPQDEFDLAFANEQVDFFQYQVEVEPKLSIVASGGTQQQSTFNVLVTRFLEHDIPDTGYNASVDSLESIYSLVRTALGPRWQDTVDFYDVKQIRSPAPVNIQDRLVWQSSYLYQAVKVSA